MFGATAPSVRGTLLNVALALVVALAVYKFGHHAEGRFDHLRARAQVLRIRSSGLRLLTANVQRLPYLLGRPPADIATMLRDHDVVCLQEDFQPWQTLARARASGALDAETASYCFPGGTWRTLLNSGLSIWSRFPMRLLSFQRFPNLLSVDRLADKGFLVVSVGGLIIVNTHLQATYDYRNLHYGVAHEQVRQIRAWLRHHYRHRPAIIVGDFNFDLRAASERNQRRNQGGGQIENRTSFVHPAVPTTWSRMDSVLETSSAVPRHGFLPLTCDGAIHDAPATPHVEHVRVDAVATHRLDPHTDHLAVSMVVRLAPAT